MAGLCRPAGFEPDLKPDRGGTRLIERIAVTAFILVSACVPGQGAAESTDGPVGDTVSLTVAASSGLVPGLDPYLFYSTRRAWRWTPADGLYYAFPDRWAEFGYDFNASIYRQNVNILCGWGRGAEDLASYLFDRLMAHVDDRGFLVHPFPYGLEGSRLNPPWVSGLGNGAVLAGTVALYECFGDQRYLDGAYRLFNAYRIRREDGGFTEDLGDGSLWFEEYPFSWGVPPRVLNGHIHAIWGLYYLFEATGDRDVLEYIHRGVEAVAERGPQYRRPGQVNLYDLRPPETDDYGPARSIYQQDVLCQMTRDPRFLELRDQFIEDMPGHVAEIDVELGC